MNSLIKINGNGHHLASRQDVPFLGQLPPQALDLERAVLGVLLLDKSAYEITSEILTPDCFYADAHQIIYETIAGMHHTSFPVDMLTVAEVLKKKDQLENVGGAAYITRLTNGVVSTANTEAHSRIILEKYILRELIKVNSEVVAEAYGQHVDVFDLLDKHEQCIGEIGKHVFRTHTKTMVENMMEFYQDLDAKMLRQDHLSGVPSGYYDIDVCTGGWQSTDLIILAARPSVGKTSLALNFARNACNAGNPVAFFSLEMSTNQLIQRLTAGETLIQLNKIRSGKLSQEERQKVDKSTRRLEQMPLYINDTGGLTWQDIKIKSRKLVNKNGVRLIIVDYLQMMQDVRNNDRRNREQVVANIATNLKQMAKELNVPVIALSQLSRKAEDRGKFSEPQLSDLRESGAIEQDADLVAFIYKGEHADINGETKIRIAKHRNGAVETLTLVAKHSVQRFYLPQDSALVDIDRKIIKGSWTPYQDNPFEREKD